MFRYVESLRPIEVHVQIAEPSIEGLTAHIRYVRSRMRVRAKLPKNERLVYAIQQNGRAFRQANAAERKVLADWMRDDAELFQACSLGVSFVIESTVIRGALTAVFWLQTTPVPYRVHATLEEAVTIALQELTTAGVEVPSVLVRDRADAVRREIARAMSA